MQKKHNECIIIYILKLLHDYTSFEYPLSQIEISSQLDKLGISCCRKTVGRNLQYLIALGLPIKKRGKNSGFYYDHINDNFFNRFDTGLIKASDGYLTDCLADNELCEKFDEIYKGKIYRKDNEIIKLIDKQKARDFYYEVNWKLPPDIRKRWCIPRLVWTESLDGIPSIIYAVENDEEMPSFPETQYIILLRTDQRIRYFTIEYNKKNYLWEYTGDKRFNYGFIDFKEESLKIKQILGKDVAKRVVKESSRFSQEQLLKSKSATFDDFLLDF